MGLLSRSDPAAELARVEKEVERHKSALNQAGVALLQARHDIAQLYAAGATQEELDVADRRILVADRTAALCEGKRDRLAEQRKAAVHALRVHQENAARAAAIEAGLAHVEAARKASATGAEYLQRKYEADTARYVLTPGELPEIPVNIIDLSNSTGAFASVSPVHEAVERFGFLIRNLSQRLAP